MLNELLQPVSESLLNFVEGLEPFKLGRNIKFYKDQIPEPEDVDLVIIGVQEDRNAIGNAGCAQGPDEVRKYLYSLSKGDNPMRIADLGNFIQGHGHNDSIAGLGDIVGSLLEIGLLPIIIGGSQDLTFGQYLGYFNSDKRINLSIIDRELDVYQDEEEGEINSRNFLYKILEHSPGSIFNVSVLGYQNHFLPPGSIDSLEKLHFECLRLSQIRDNFEEVEPVIRDADLVSFDIGAIRQSDAPGNGMPGPNGFFGEEICRMARYAGITDKVSSVGFYGYNPTYDTNGLTAHLTAQMIWYFIEGYYSRVNEFPDFSEKHFFKYTVQHTNSDDELTFWKSKSSGRWWMELPANDEDVFPHYWIPCSYSDYETACKDEIPERWIRALSKLG